MGSCGGLTPGGIFPNTEEALNFASQTINEVFNRAKDAYNVANSLLNYISTLVDIGNINTNIGIDSPKTLPDISAYLGAIPTSPDLGDISAPSPITYNFSESVYISNLDTLLNNILYDEINNGSTGLTVVVEDDIYNRENERDLQELADTKLRIASMWAENNSPLPDAVLYALQAYSDIKYQMAKSDKSRDVRIESFKRADDNTRFVKDLTMKFESTIREYMGKYWERQLKKASDVLEWAERAYESLLKWKALLIELFKGQSQNYEAQTHAIGAIAGVEIAKYEAVDHYNIASANLQMEGIRAQVELLKGKVQAAIAASDAIGRVASTLAAGALSAINAGANITYTGHESRSLDGNVSTSCQDSYQHEAS